MYIIPLFTWLHATSEYGHGLKQGLKQGFPISEFVLIIAKPNNE